MLNKSKLHEQQDEKQGWQPTARLEAMQARAQLYADIRSFFATRKVLEVETPLLCATGVTDLHIQAMPALYAESIQADPKTLYLQTSPEFAMKRLLAAGCGSMYQLCKAFRNGERGRFHNPEFTILEWYRIGWDHHQLMDEMDEFLNCTLGTVSAKRFSYQELFLQYLNVDPHTASLETLINTAVRVGINVSGLEADALSRDDWLDLLITHHIEPTLKGPAPFFIYDYPASQAALAKVKPAEFGRPAVAERFEVYMEGIELANGYHELCDADIQMQRFQQDNRSRFEKQLSCMEPDLRLVQALRAGFPRCAGVALGVDRLLMLKLKSRQIDEVLTFPIELA